jgi:hypothetical protein
MVRRGVARRSMGRSSMRDLTLTRAEPEGAAAAVAVRRLREAPALWLPVVLVAAAAAVRVVAGNRDDARWSHVALVAPAVPAIAALLVAEFLSGRFRATPAAADDDPKPVPVRWLDPPPGYGLETTAWHAHVLASSLRIVRRTPSRRDILGVAVLACAGAAALGWLGAPAAVAVAWAFGFPRPARRAVDVPWGDVESLGRVGPNHFRVTRSLERGDLVLDARYAHADRLAQRLGERLGSRFRTEAAALRGAALPAVLRPAVGDEDAGVAELVLRRVRRHSALATAMVCLLLSGTAFAVSHVFDDPLSRVVASVLAIGGSILAFIGARARGDLWRGSLPAADDSPDPLPVRWTNRPGWPGPGPQQVHLLARSFRVVGLEWEAWDVVVVAAWALVGLPVGGWVGALAVTTILNAVGIPRRRRVAIDVPWDEVVRVEVRGGAFAVRSRLPAPADLIRVEAKFSARERLTTALTERLGDRVDLVVRVRSGTSP